jgi:hypothetical protein
MKPTAFVLLLALPLLASAQSQTIWRCGADGASYSATPCPEGRELQRADARPVAEIGAARQLAEREQRMAGALTRERQQREAKAVGAGLAGFATAQAPAVKSTKDTPRLIKRRGQQSPASAADGTWRAVVPATRRTQG